MEKEQGMKEKKEKWSHIAGAAAKGILTMVLCGILIWFMMHRELYMTKEHVQMGRIAGMILLCLSGIGLVWMPYPFRDRKRIGTVLLVFLALMAGVVNFFCMEIINGDLSKLRHLIGLANLLVIYFLMMTVFAIANRIKPAIIVTTLILYIFTTGNYFTNLFRGIPVLASDFLLLSTALSVAGEFTYTISFEVLVYTMLVLLIILLLARIPEQQKLTGRLRWGYLGGYCILLGAFLYIFAFSNTLERLNIKVHHFNPNRSYASNGSIMTFARSIQMVGLKAPEGYSPKKVRELAAPYIMEFQEDTKEYKTPNVIVVMNEAFSDLQSVNGAFETNMDVMPVIHSLTQNTVKGTAYSSVFGGYTANSEYEMLTGHSMAFLNGVVPFQFLIKKPMANLTTQLAGLGYGSLLAIHPYKKSGYNREAAYKNLGFSSFRAIEDMGDREHEYVRNRISDADDALEVIQQYEKIRQTTDAPVFFFNVTMQNHSPWDEVFDNFNPDVEVLDEEYNTFELRQYLSLIKLSDAAFGQLMDYFQGVKEDTVIVFFGDHQPKLDTSFYNRMLGKKASGLTAEETMQKYQVPYVIWTNYDMEKKEYGEISLNYLSAVMADAAGMKLTPYQRYLMELRDQVPVITAHGYWDKDHHFYEDADADSPYKDALDLYEYTQYNNLADTKNRVENFFD